MYNKTSYLLIMLLVGATITIAIPSKSNRRPSKHNQTPFDVDEVIHQVRHQSQPNFQEHETKNHPLQDEFLIDTCIKYIPAAYNQSLPSVAFDSTNYFVVWADFHLDAVVGTRVSQSGEILDKVGIKIANANLDLEEGPSIAYGDNYFVVWKDESSEGIFGTRVNNSGVILDTTPIPICTTYQDNYELAVAHGDSTFMVVWTYYGSEVIFGARVSDSGIVLDTFPIPICTTYYYGYRPSVGFDGTNFMVVWDDWTDIFGSRVSPAGEVLDSLGITILHSIPDIYEPVVCFGGENYFVIWTDERNLIDTDIYGARVSTDGIVLDPGGVPVSTAPGAQYSPSITFGGENYFVSWTDSSSGLDDAIFGARVNQSGIVLDTAGIVISSAVDNQISHSVASSGNEYFVFWTAESLYKDIFGARINPAGALLDSVGILISMQCNNQWRPKVAFDGTNYLIVWQDNYTSNYDIYGARVNQAGLVIDSVNIPITALDYNQYYPSVAFDGTNYLVVWQDETGGSNIFGARVNQDGIVLDTNGFCISNTDYRCCPAVAFDSINYLVVWSYSYHIYGARVTQEGIILDTNGFAISTAQGIHRFPSVTFNGTNYFIVWESNYIIYNYIYGARVNQNGIVLDTNGILISTGDRDKRVPSAAFDGQNYLVVWEEDHFGSWFDIYGTRVNQDGVVLDTNGIVISSAVRNQYSPSVVFDGSNYFIAWQDGRNGNDYDIYSAKLNRSGNIIDSLPISMQPGDQSIPSIAVGGSNRILITYSGWTDSINHHYVNATRIWGKFYPYVGITEENPNVKMLSAELIECYPNPFRNKTLIKYSITKVGDISLKIYDIGGRLVRNLFNGFQDLGVYTVNWNGTDDFARKLPAGVYFYRLERKEGVTETKELIILR